MNAVHPNAGVFVLPTTIAPAARSRATIEASVAAGLASAYSGDPYVVGSPATSVRSFTRSGTPASGPLRRLSSSASASSSAASARSRTTAFSSPFAASIRRRDSSTRSRGDTILSRTAAASCLTPLIAIGQVLQACRPHRLSCSGGPRARARSARHGPRCPGRPACRSASRRRISHATFNGRSEAPSMRSDAYRDGEGIRPHLRRGCAHDHRGRAAGERARSDRIVATFQLERVACRASPRAPCTARGTRGRRRRSSGR